MSCATLVLPPGPFGHMRPMRTLLTGGDPSRGDRAGTTVQSGRVRLSVAALSVGARSEFRASGDANKRAAMRSPRKSEAEKALSRM
jgi:hypothetical protein